MGNSESKAACRDGLVLWLDEAASLDPKVALSLIGGKSKGLGDLWSLTKRTQIRVPDAFLLTTEVYRRIIDKRIRGLLNDVLKDMNTEDLVVLDKTASHCRRILYNASDQIWLRELLYDAYKLLCRKYESPNMDLAVAVRSSATAEDLPHSSFAGQHDTFLNIKGMDQLFEAVRHCIASVFTSRAIAYREEMHYAHLDVELCVCVQMMVRSDLGASGVAFTLDVDSGNPNVVLINAAYGLGEAVVQGSINCDEYYVHSNSYLAGYRSVLHHSLGSKEKMMVYNDTTSTADTADIEVLRMQEQIHAVDTPLDARNKYCLTDKDVLSLTGDVLVIQREASSNEKSCLNYDVEFAKDGKTGTIYIVQCRRETVQSKASEHSFLEIFTMCDEIPEPITVGHAIGSRVGVGAVRFFRPESFSANSLANIEFDSGDVLACEMTHPDMVPLMRRAAAIVTMKGGQTCHAAIVARELGVPCIVGAEAMSEDLSGTLVTVCCSMGSTGYVFGGKIPFKKSRLKKSEIPRTVTRCAYNLGDPTTAFKAAQFHNEGCGLVRMEFVLSHIGVHPMAVLHEDLLDPSERQRLSEMTSLYSSAKDYFIRRLSEELALIAAAFYPQPVNIRMSDFKSNEFKNLLGGKIFEADEVNPLMGFRGAYRYTHFSYKEAFELECSVLYRIRNIIGLDNVEIMIPFVRTVDEARNTLMQMASHGLVGKTFSNVLTESRATPVMKLMPLSDTSPVSLRPLLINMMVELPCNVILIDSFCKLFDGFSIGSNDLTALTLGIDRDSSKLNYPELSRNEAVRCLISETVSGCHGHDKKVGLCGELGSDPEFVNFLIRHAIDYISVNPASIFDVLSAADKAEQSLKRFDFGEESKDDDDLSTRNVFKDLA